MNVFVLESVQKESDLILILQPFNLKLVVAKLLRSHEIDVDQGGGLGRLIPMITRCFSNFVE